MIRSPAGAKASGVTFMSNPALALTMPSSPLVCVVDPDPRVRRTVAGLMQALGAEVYGYATAREFLAGLAVAVPVCLIAEAHLPDMTGLALLQEVRSRGLNIPTILLSGDADVTSAVTAMRAGALDFVEKPFIDRVLVAQIRPILELDGQRPF